MRIDNLLFGAGLLLTAGDALAGPLAAAVVPSLLATVGGALISRAIAPKAPKITPPAVMPLADDEAATAARRRQVAEMQSRSGRASTILSSDDRLGG